MVNFRVPIMIRGLIRGLTWETPKRDHDFDNPPNVNSWVPNELSSVPFRNSRMARCSSCEDSRTFTKQS